MTDDSTIGAALVELADLANCVSNDFHCLHFNIKGVDFDTMHAKVLKRYYENAADDYDSLNEFARMYLAVVPNGCASATRISYQAFDGEVTRTSAIERCQLVMEELYGKYSHVFGSLNRLDCPKAVGVANWLQGRIEYWTKEACYFNKARKGE